MITEIEVQLAEIGAARMTQMLLSNSIRRMQQLRFDFH